jgi:hypothetical protein
MDYLSAEQYAKARNDFLKEGYSEEEADHALNEHQKTHALKISEEPKKISGNEYYTLPLATAGVGLGVAGAKKLYDVYSKPQETITKRIEPTFDPNNIPNLNNEPVMNAPVVPSAPSVPIAPTSTVLPVNQAPVQLITPQSQQAANFALNAMQPQANPTPPPPTPAQQAIEQVTETAPKPAVPPTMPMGEIAQNPVQSGEGTSPLHEPGQASGATQLEATQASTGVAQPKANTAIPTESSATETNAPKESVAPIQKEVKTRRPRNTIPEGQVFKEGFGGADNWLQNAVGHDIRRFIRDTFNEGKPYGSGEEAVRKAYEDVNKYEKWLKENIPEQTYNRAERKHVGLPPPENYGKLGKIAKIGGVMGLLMTAEQAAQAKNLREAQRNVGESLLPLSVTPIEVQKGTLPPEILQQYSEYGKLGSPYREAFLKQTGKK